MTDPDLQVAAVVSGISQERRESIRTAVIKWMREPDNNLPEGLHYTIPASPDDVLDLLAALVAAETERDQAIRKSDQWQRHAGTSDREVAALRTTVLAVVEVLNIIPGVVPSLLWSDALPAILARINEIVDETDRAFRERDRARNELAATQETLHKCLRTRWDDLTAEEWAIIESVRAAAVSGREQDGEEQT